MCQFPSKTLSKDTILQRQKELRRLVEKYYVEHDENSFVASAVENYILPVDISVQEESDIEQKNVEKQAGEYDSNDRIEEV